MKVVHLDRTQAAELQRVLSSETRAPRETPRGFLGGAVLATAVAALTAGLSEVPYVPPPSRGAELVVSFKLPGRTGEHCRTLTQEEQQKLPPHMRRDRDCQRGRVPVRLRVEVDGTVVHDGSYAPRGLFGDGTSLAVVDVPVAAAEHRVGVALGDSSDAAEWTFHDERTVKWNGEERHVVLFDRTNGFTWE